MTELFPAQAAPATGKARRRWLWLILLSYLLLAVAYALATPPLEASDEYKHYPLVQYVQTMGELPVLNPADPGRWLQEGAQPPLYYYLMAGLTAWIDTRDLAEVHRINRYAFVGNPNQVGNKNLILHRPQAEAFPWQGAVLAVYVIRFASILLGVGTVVLTARLGTLLFGEMVGLLAAAFTAFTPMFLFVSAAVNNDSLAILLGHLGLFLLLCLWRDAPDPRHHWFRYASLGVVLGLGLLTKLSLGGLLGLAGLALAWLAWRRRQWRYLFLSGGLVALPALALAAPWLWRNWRLYGDPTALDVFVAVQGTRDEPLTWRHWIEEFGTFYRSYWGLFGGVNVAAPQWLYTAYNAAAVAAAAGFVWGWHRRRLPAGTWLLLVWPLLLFALLLRWNVISPAFQGRLIFPALGALSVLGAAGLLHLVRVTIRPRLALALAVLAFVVAASLPWLVIRPAYAYPEPLAAVPAGADFGPVTFHAPDGAIRLVGVEMPPDQTVVPGGGPVAVVLYWEAASPVADNYLSAVHLLGRGLQAVGAVNRHPAGGMVPTSHWQPGQIWRDVYHLYVDEAAVTPARLQVRVGLYDPAVDGDLAMSGPDGTPFSLLVVGEARLAARPDVVVPTPPRPHEVVLADGITLRGYSLAPQPARPGDVLQVTLYWQAHGVPSRDYTVFVHLLNPAGEQVVVADGPPLDSDYPTTFWRPGDAVRDGHAVLLPADLPPGTYKLAIGLYDPVSGGRLARQDGGDSILLPVAVSR